MREVTQTYTVAKFKELTKEQQTKVLDKLRYLNTDHNWHSDTIAEFKRDLEALGFSKVEINFTGFASQGDGASFTGDFSIPSKREAIKRLKSFQDRCGIKKFIQFADQLMDYKFTKEDKENGVSVYRLNSHYYHEYTIKSDCDFVDEWAQNYAREIYKSLKAEHEYLTSDEAIKESIESNDYEFNISTLEIA